MTNQSHAAGSLDQVHLWRPCDKHDAFCRAQEDLRQEYRATFKLIANFERRGFIWCRYCDEDDIDDEDYKSDRKDEIKNLLMVVGTWNRPSNASSTGYIEWRASKAKDEGCVKIDWIKGRAAWDFRLKGKCLIWQGQVQLTDDVSSRVHSGVVSAMSVSMRTQRRECQCVQILISILHRFKTSEHPSFALRCMKRPLGCEDLINGRRNNAIFAIIGASTTVCWKCSVHWRQQRKVCQSALRVFIADMIPTLLPFMLRYSSASRSIDTLDL